MNLQRSSHDLCSFLVLLILCCVAEIAGMGEVIWAVNAGGDAHVDVYGIHYQRDSLGVGTPSDYGRSLVIQRVQQQDQILYQTERYHTESFFYDTPITKDGSYVLVLKFSEVWFAQQNLKVFDVKLNGEHVVVDGLDIYQKVGRGVAHDEVVPFTVKNGVLKVNGESSTMSNNKLKVEFVKLDRDNPKINAMYLMRGTLDDVPELPPMPGLNEPHDIEEEEDDDEGEESVSQPPRKRPAADPKVQDPYASDDTSSMMLPVLVAIGAFIPLLFCLCKL